MDTFANRQTPLGSGFGPATTADDVLAGADLAGMTAIVTGGYSGLGLATSVALAGAGARVIVPARRPDVAHANLDPVPGAEVVTADLADLDQVSAFARRLDREGVAVDFIIAGAGVMANPLTRVGPGWESQFAINHLAHYALVNLVAPLLSSGARVVSVSSGAHAISPIRWHDVHFEREPYDPWAAYGQSKTANALFAVHLDVMGSERGIHAFSAHPGSILTPLQRHISRERQIEMGWIDEHGRAAAGFKSPSQGAATAVWAATSAALAGRGGEYCEDCDIAPVARDGVEGGVAPWAVDPEQARRLWEYSATLTGIDAWH